MISRLKPALSAGRQSKAASIIGDVMWQGSGNALTILTSMASLLMLVREFGAAGYGVYLGIFGVIGPLAALTYSGIALGVVQRRLREKDDLAEVARAAFSLMTLLGVLGVVAATSINLLIVDGVRWWTLALFGYSELWMSGYVSVTAAVARAEVGVSSSARIHMGFQSVRVSVLTALFVTDSLDIDSLALGFAGGATLYVAFLALRRLPKLGARPDRLSKPAGTFVSTSSQLALPAFASSLQINADKAVLNAYGFASDAGLYGAAFRVATLALMPIKSLNGATFHRFLDHDERKIGQHVRRAQRFVMASLPVSLLIAVFMFFAAPYLDLLIGDEFSESTGILRWLLIYIILRSVSQAPLHGLLGLGRIKLRVAVLLTSSITSLVLYVTLVPTWSWKGAVVGTIASEALLAAIGWAALVRAQHQHDDIARQANASS